MNEARTNPIHWETSKNGKLRIAKLRTDRQIEVWALRTGTHDLYRAENFKLTEDTIARKFANDLWAGRI